MDRKTKVLETRSGIKESLLRVMVDKPFDHVNVTEVCDGASVNRTTFYHHYHSLDDVLIEIMGDILGQMDILCGRCLGCGLPTAGVPICQFIRNNHQYLPIFRSSDLLQYFIGRAISKNKHSFEDWLSNTDSDGEYPDTVLGFTLYGCIAIVWYVASAILAMVLSKRVDKDVLAS